jgi:hypothetical protein
LVAIKSQHPALKADGQKLNDLWNEYIRAEFAAHSPDEAIVTMVANLRVNQVPVMIGGDGRDELYEFYGKYFLPQIPPDMEMVPVSRTIGQGRVVDEMVARFTHTIPMDWMLRGSRALVVRRDTVCGRGGLPSRICRSELPDAPFQISLPPDPESLSRSERFSA